MGHSASSFLDCDFTLLEWFFTLFIRSLGYPWHAFLCFKEIRKSCLWDILLQISMIFHDQTKSVMNLKKQFYYIDMIMYHCNFFEVDPRTLESPHGTFLQRLTVKMSWFLLNHDAILVRPSFILNWGDVGSGEVNSNVVSSAYITHLQSIQSGRETCG